MSAFHPVDRHRPTHLVAVVVAVLLVAAQAMAGCSGQTPRLDQATARAALLTEAEFPDGGWRLVQATQTAPARPTSPTPFTSGECGRALALLDGLEHGSDAYVKGSYAKDDAPLVDVVVQGYPSVPSDLTRLTDIIRGCSGGTLDQAGTQVPFTLVPRSYPQSGASGARLTITPTDGARAIDIAVAVRGETAVVGTATGADSPTAAGQVTDLLDGVVTAQLRKLEETLADR